MRDFVSTYQVAQALGVSVSTVKRWVDQGILPAVKTVGGHRKLLLSDVLRLARSGQFPLMDLTRLGLPDTNKIELAFAEIQGKFFESIHQGDEELAGSILISALRNGASLVELADQVVGPAMHTVGDRWERATLDVYQEHRATHACLNALSRLRQVLLESSAQARIDPVALGAVIERDPSTVGAYLGELVLIEGGWRVINLGGDTPFASLERAWQDLRPELTFVSATHLADRAIAEKYLERLQRMAESESTPIIVGGRGMPCDLADSFPAIRFGENMQDLALFAEQLRVSTGDRLNQVSEEDSDRLNARSKRSAAEDVRTEAAR